MILAFLTAYVFIVYSIARSVYNSKDCTSYTTKNHLEEIKEYERYRYFKDLMNGK